MDPMKKVVSFLTLTLFLFNQVASTEAAYYLRSRLMESEGRHKSLTENNPPRFLADSPEQSRLRTPTTASRPNELVEALGVKAARASFAETSAAKDGGEAGDQETVVTKKMTVAEAFTKLFPGMSPLSYTLHWRPKGSAPEAYQEAPSDQVLRKGDSVKLVHAEDGGRGQIAFEPIQRTREGVLEFVSRTLGLNPVHETNNPLEAHPIGFLWHQHVAGPLTVRTSVFQPFYDSANPAEILEAFIEEASTAENHRLFHRALQTGDEDPMEPLRIQLDAWRGWDRLDAFLSRWIVERPNRWQAVPMIQRTFVSSSDTRRQRIMNGQPIAFEYRPGGQGTIYVASELEGDPEGARKVFQHLPQATYGMKLPADSRRRLLAEAKKVGREQEKSGRTAQDGGNLTVALQALRRLTADATPFTNMSFDVREKYFGYVDRLRDVTDPIVGRQAYDLIGQFAARHRPYGATSFDAIRRFDKRIEEAQTKLKERFGFNRAPDGGRQKPTTPERFASAQDGGIQYEAVEGEVQNRIEREHLPRTALQPMAIRVVTMEAISVAESKTFDIEVVQQRISEALKKTQITVSTPTLRTLATVAIDVGLDVRITAIEDMNGLVDDDGGGRKTARDGGEMSILDRIEDALDGQHSHYAVVFKRVEEKDLQVRATKRGKVIMVEYREGLDPETVVGRVVRHKSFPALPDEVRAVFDKEARASRDGGTGLANSFGLNEIRGNFSGYVSPAVVRSP